MESMRAGGLARMYRHSPAREELSTPAPIHKLPILTWKYTKQKERQAYANAGTCSICTFLMHPVPHMMPATDQYPPAHKMRYA